MERSGGPLIYVSRLVRLPLLDSEGTALGRVADVVLGPPSGRETPRVIGFVAVVQRRRIVLRWAEIDGPETLVEFVLDDVPDQRGKFHWFAQPFRKQHGLAQALLDFVGQFSQ